MAFTSKEIPDQREGAVDGQVKRTYRRRFWVDTDDAHYGTKAVIDHVIGTYDVPIFRRYQVGVQGTDAWYEADPGAGVQAIHALNDGGGSDDPCRWTVDVEYGPQDPRLEENPLDTPPIVEYDFAQFEAIADRDINGVAITNSTGDDFDPPVTKDDSRPVLKVQVNLKHFDDNWADTYRDSVNEFPWLGRAERTVKVAAIRAVSDFHPSVPGDHIYYKAYLEFHVNPDTWDKAILDQGLYYRDASDVYKPILVDGLPATAPQLLDGDGAPLAFGDDAVYMVYEVYKKYDFAQVFGFGG
jgi:hypothetical protein